MGKGNSLTRGSSWLANGIFQEFKRFLGVFLTAFFLGIPMEGVGLSPEPLVSPRGKPSPEAIRDGDTFDPENSDLRVLPEAVPWRILSIVIRTTDLTSPSGYEKTGFSEADFEEIKKSHSRFEAWLIHKTGGRIRPSTDILLHPGPLRSMTRRKKEETHQDVFWANPDNLPGDLGWYVPNGVYQSIFVWVRTPDALSRYGGGVTDSALWHGTSYAVSMRKDPPTNRIIILSHEFYHQVTLLWGNHMKRASPVFPSNHPPNTILAGGKLLLPEKKTREEWYYEVLHSCFPQNSWKEMLAWQRARFQTVEGNIAPQGSPIGDASTGKVIHLARLNDGNADDSAMSDPPSRKPVTGWLGLEFPQPVRVGRIRFQFGYSLADEKSYLPENFCLEIERKGLWEVLPGGNISGNRKKIFEHSWPSELTSRVRIRIDSSSPDDRKAFYRMAIREIEVFDH